MYIYAQSSAQAYAARRFLDESYQLVFTDAKLDTDLQFFVCELCVKVDATTFKKTLDAKYISRASPIPGEPMYDICLPVVYRTINRINCLYDRNLERFNRTFSRPCPPGYGNKNVFVLLGDRWTPGPYEYESSSDATICTAFLLDQNWIPRNQTPLV